MTSESATAGSDQMFLGECSVCRQGQLVAVKNLETGSLLVMCDDCESQWQSPTDACSYANVLVPEVRHLTDASPGELRDVGWVPTVCCVDRQ